MHWTFWFWQNKDTSRAENIKKFLDYLELRMGLPRSVRENHQNVKELGDWYQNNQVVLHFKVIAEAPNEFNDGKRIEFNIPKDVIPANADIMPQRQSSAPANPTSTSSPASNPVGPGITNTPVSSTSTSSPSTTQFAKGQTVSFMEDTWTVIEVYDSKLEIRNIADPSVQKMAFKTACVVS